MARTSRARPTLSVNWSQVPERDSAVEIVVDVAELEAPYGRTLAGVKLWPLTTPFQSPTSSPSLVYPLHLLKGPEIKFNALPPTARGCQPGEREPLRRGAGRG